MSSNEYHSKVSDQFKMIRDHFLEHAEKNKVDPVIREHIKSDIDTLIGKNERLSK